jgi:5-hydroxyisourate hydrolase-like protein (transthyretin family)
MNARRLGRWVVSATALILFTLNLASPGRATAGEFTITDCGADGGSYATTAFEDFATRGMRWRRACDPQGPGLRGLVTANVAGSGRVAEGAQSAFVMEAPPGTTFSRFRWSGAMHRRDCRYALQVYAVKPDESAVPIKNVRANHGCPPSGDAQASGWPHPRAWDLGGATRIVQRVVCMGGSGEQSCSARGQNYVQTFTAEATVVDNSGPSVSIAPDGPLARGEWVRGPQALGFEASDNIGIKEAWVSSASGSVGRGEGRACDYAQRIPCPSGPGHLEVETERLPREGTQELQVMATDAAGNQSASAPVTARVDNAAPGAVPVAVEGGEAWRNRNAYSLAWQNPAEPDRAPIVAAHYRLCRAGTKECSLGENAGPGVAAIASLNVPSPGEWELRIWRQDAAGNQQPENASVPVKLRFDPEPPQLGFEAPSPSDPTRVSVQATDSLSGIGGGEVTISRIGSGAWQVLPTTQEAGHITTRIDDAALPPGEYELKATAHDQAGNLASTGQRLDGQPMKVTLPLRTSMSLGAGILEKRRAHRHHHGGKAPKVAALVPHSEVKYGKKVQFAGHLVDSAGNPLAGAQVQAFTLPKEGAEQQIATLTTDEEGKFGYELTAQASQEVRFTYGGDSTHLPAEGKASLDVSGASSFKVNHDHVLNGQSVEFSGTVRGRPLPATGKLVELQVLLSDKWQTFRTARSEPDGTWRIVYRFKRTCGVALFPFRLLLPEEAGYSLTAGTSRHVTVKVKGQPCAG